MRMTLNPDSKKTQRSNTSATYLKLAQMDSVKPGPMVLDYGSGKGHGTLILKNHWSLSTVHSYEPFPDGNPDFTHIDQIPHNCYDVIVCFNVLNVIQGHGQRAMIISNLLNCLNPEGQAIIGVRTVQNVAAFTKTATSCGDAEWEYPNGSFQKGFNKEILESEVLSDSRTRIQRYIKGLNPLTIVITKGN